MSPVLQYISTFLITPADDTPHPALLTVNTLFGMISERVFFFPYLSSHADWVVLTQQLCPIPQLSLVHFFENLGPNSLIIIYQVNYGSV